MEGYLNPPCSRFTFGLNTFFTCIVELIKEVDSCDALNLVDTHGIIPMAFVVLAPTISTTL